MPQLGKIVLFAIILFGAISTFAWDDTGHKITAYIAWNSMTPAVRERVVAILMEAPEDSTIGPLYQNYGSRSVDTRRREFFMLMATWADMVRDRKFDTRYRKYHHSNWHYSDKFWRRDGDKIEYLPAPEDGGQALERLQEYSRMIVGRSPDREKAIAIAWIQHLIGDLHQPLHTSARVTETEPKGDQGGNLFLLTPQGTPRDKQENLHWFWDSIIVRNTPNSKNECDAEFLDPIAESIMKEHPRSAMQKDIRPGDFEGWIKDSLSLAQSDVFSPDLKRFEMPTDKYKKKAYKLARQRLALAGYRMADMFTSAFGPGATAQPSPVS